MYVDDQYPPGAAQGCDYLTRAPLGTVLIRHRDGSEELRPERVVITDVDIDYDGRVCIGERTVRHLAHLFGMIDDWSYDDLAHAYLTVVEEVTRLDHENGRLHDVLGALKALEQDAPTQVFVDANGDPHRSQRAAATATRKAVSLPDPQVAPAVVADQEVPA